MALVRRGGAGGVAARATLTALSLATSAPLGRVDSPRYASLAPTASALCRPIDVTLTCLKFHIVFVLRKAVALKCASDFEYHCDSLSDCC
ncbi:jg16368 [Pararge aegeria aegeria]|uniref:Jg16368 protein n=1 Tax=Pararge aegeria aegeria TaxID=348720 RepID=A0A8S4RH85_9NEOP|nr:jg16368 [Pararge aegeria aegeria]